VKHQEILAAGTSIWLDDLSRSKLTGTDRHSLPHRIAHDGVRGVTTNPSIFGAAITGADEYAADIASLAGKSVEDVVRTLTTDDVSVACDLFSQIYQESNGIDGRVSIEVDPRLAHKTQETIDEGIALYALVNRPNVMIKVPATKAGLPATTALIAEGISVNVTLIFSIERYSEVIDAFIAGIAQAKAAGRDLATIHSVASFFISRIDSAVDKELKAIGNSDLLGKIAVANAHRAYALFLEKFGQAEWKALASAGARVQRPLWASTGVKDPAYPDTLYVDELVAPDTVNTMPQSTLDAVLDHGVLKVDAVTSHMDSAVKTLAALAQTGISLDAITDNLEADGVKKFEEAWISLLADVSQVMKS
jgi:transaldolase